MARATDRPGHTDGIPNPPWTLSDYRRVPARCMSGYVVAQTGECARCGAAEGERCRSKDYPVTSTNKGVQT